MGLHFASTATLVGALSILLLIFASQSSCVPFSLPLLISQYSLALTTLKWTCVLAVGWAANTLSSRSAEDRWVWNPNPVPWDWSKEVAVVTGGSNGLGASLVRKLLSHGIRVAVLDIEPLSSDLQNAAEANKLSFHRCNITSREAVHRAAEAIRAEFGPPSILVNNAGIGNADSILDIPPERLRTIFDVNLISHWYTVQEFLPDMIRRKKGHVMGVASMAAFLGIAGMVDYSATKAGLQAFYEGLAQELKHRYHCPYIKSSIVYPPWTRTRLTKAVEQTLEKRGESLMDPDEVTESMCRQIIAARSGQLILGHRLAFLIRAFPLWLQEAVRDSQAAIVTTKATTAVA